MAKSPSLPSATSSAIGKTIHPHPSLGESFGMAAQIPQGLRGFFYSSLRLVRPETTATSSKLATHPNKISNQIVKRTRCLNERKRAVNPS